MTNSDHLVLNITPQWFKRKTQSLFTNLNASHKHTSSEVTIEYYIHNEQDASFKTIQLNETLHETLEEEALLHFLKQDKSRALKIKEHPKEWEELLENWRAWLRVAALLDPSQVNQICPNEEAASRINRVQTGTMVRQAVSEYSRVQNKILPFLDADAVLNQSDVFPPQPNHAFWTGSTWFRYRNIQRMQQQYTRVQNLIESDLHNKINETLVNIGQHCIPKNQTILSTRQPQYQIYFQSVTHPSQAIHPEVEKKYPNQDITYLTQKAKLVDQHGNTLGHVTSTLPVIPSNQTGPDKLAFPSAQIALDTRIINPTTFKKTFQTQFPIPHRLKRTSNGFELRPQWRVLELLQQLWQKFINWLRGDKKSVSSTPQTKSSSSSQTLPQTHQHISQALNFASTKPDPTAEYFVKPEKTEAEKHASSDLDPATRRRTQIIYETHGHKTPAIKKFIFQLLGGSLLFYFMDSLYSLAELMVT